MVEFLGPTRCSKGNLFKVTIFFYFLFFPHTVPCIIHQKGKKNYHTSLIVQRLSKAIYRINLYLMDST